MSTTNLGKVTAYAYAVAGGYTGNEAEFEAILGNIASGHGSIANIEKTGTAGSVDTYTITFTDGTTATFDITNGEVTEAQLETVLEAYAKTDGYYESMTVGNAEQLNSSVGIVDKEPYNYRTAGGSVEIGNRAYSKWVGGSLPVNQILNESSFSDLVTGKGPTVNLSNHRLIIQGTTTAGCNYFFAQGKELLANHKYVLAGLNKHQGMDLLVYNGTHGLIASLSRSATATSLFINPANTANYNIYFNIGQGGSVVDIDCIPQLIDLTQMFGTTIADYIYSLETATPGAGVAWFKKYFPYDYYAYQTPTLEHVTISEYQTTELNQWDEQWKKGDINTSTGVEQTGNRVISKNFCRCLPSTSYCFLIYQRLTGQGIRVFWYDENQNFVGTVAGLGGGEVKVSPSNAFYFKIMANDPYGTTYNNDICINLHWDGEMDGVYQPYKLHSYPLDDSIVLRGVPKKDDSGKLYFDGDTWEADGTVTRKYGVVTFDGSSSTGWVYQGDYGTVSRFDYDGIASTSKKGTGMNTNLVTNQFPLGIISTANLECCNIQGSNGYLQIQILSSKLSEKTPAGLRAYFQSHPLTAVYELATPTTEQGPEFNEPQVVDNFGTEALLGSSIPVGHETNYTANLRAKIETAPDSPDGDGDYIMRQTSGANAYVELGSTTTIQNIISRLEALEAE